MWDSVFVGVHQYNQSVLMYTQCSFQSESIVQIHDFRTTVHKWLTISDNNVLAAKNERYGACCCASYVNQIHDQKHRLALNWWYHSALCGHLHCLHWQTIGPTVCRALSVITPPQSATLGLHPTATAVTLKQ